MWLHHSKKCDDKVFPKNTAENQDPDTECTGHQGTELDGS